MRASRHLSILILMLLILGAHDVLMAANPHAGDTAHAGLGTSTLAATRLIAEGVQTSSPDLSLAVTAGVGMLIPVTVPVFREIAWISWLFNPEHPPDVRRALLQVFLN